MKQIRKLKEEDIPVILDWYNWYILNGTETFETQALTMEQFIERVHTIMKEYPFIVLEENGQLAGYAYLDHFNARAAYDWTADLSIYLDPQNRGKGNGSLLMEAILSLAKKDGYHNVISIITETNKVSEHFHEKFGFQKMASFPSLGYKFGQWLGVTYYLKQLAGKEQGPAPVRNLYE
jgi:L-amino acid N-acyltransferase YncA